MMPSIIQKFFTFHFKLSSNLISYFKFNVTCLVDVPGPVDNLIKFLVFLGFSRKKVVF